MFVTANQIYIFIATIIFGIIAGFPLGFIRKKLKKCIKNRIILTDVLWFLTISVAYIFYSFALNFPSFRIYMPLGVLFGMYLYIIFLNNILEKVFVKCYNKFIKERLYGNKFFKRRK